MASGREERSSGIKISLRRLLVGPMGTLLQVRKTKRLRSDETFFNETMAYDDQMAPWGHNHD